MDSQDSIKQGSPRSIGLSWRAFLALQFALLLITALIAAGLVVAERQSPSFFALPLINFGWMGALLIAQLVTCLKLPWQWFWAVFLALLLWGLYVTAFVMLGVNLKFAMGMPL